MGGKMKSKKKWLMAFFLMLILLSCGKKENKGSNVENKSNTEQPEEQLLTFKDKSIERVISDFEIISKENFLKELQVIVTAYENIYNDSGIQEMFEKYKKKLSFK